MRDRALLHVGGPTGSGKTTFIERLFGAEVAFATCVRTECDPKVKTEKESSLKTHPEFRRYREAGASAAALWRFAEPSMEAFFNSEVMQHYSEAVFIEGDCPVEYVDLSVFVAPAPSKGRSLLRRVVRDHAAAYQASIERFAQALESREAMARLLGAGVGEPLVAMALSQPRALDELRRSMQAKLVEVHGAPPPAPTEHWALDDNYAGLEHAQLVVVNVRAGDYRGSADALVEDVARLRKDEAIFRDVMGRGSRLPVTAVVADLSNPKDPGLKKAVARVKRATKRRSS